MDEAGWKKKLSSEAMDDHDHDRDAMKKTWPIRGHNAPIFSPSRLACKCCFFMPFLPVLSSREEKPVEINDSEILIQWQGCRQSRGFLRFAASCPTSSRLRAVLPTFLSRASIVDGRGKEKKTEKRTNAWILSVR